MKVGRGTATWARRGVLAVVLLGAAVTPGRAASQSTTSHCAGFRCQASGSILWTKELTGSWLAADGVAGTVPADGEAYVASAADLAVLGNGTTVTGYRARTGDLLWQVSLSGLPAGAAIISMRAWPGIVAAGVTVPSSSGPGERMEVMLAAATGRQIRMYPAAYYGGAVQASPARTVIVGAGAVTCYANGSGRVLWRQPTGSAAQDWEVSGGSLYLAVTAGGYLSASPVTALRRIDLSTGAEHLIRPPAGPFTGTLAGIVGGVALFSSGNGLQAYSLLTGTLMWHRLSAVLELVDQSQSAAYIATGNLLYELDLATGKTRGHPARAVSAGLYAVRAGVGLGLDQDGLGDAWGYDMATRKIIWTSAALPWPHFFADLTGLGGSTGMADTVTLLTTCAAVGGGKRNGAAPCLRPELAAIRF
ncbi:MAG TPA: PQQ-binding-like beta-propeller repeat protein [Streptosporangiaceae bacterium]|nr:PQQ-binding-like beta-propeller repeat protein [Streptosporangiaceae bacterium]